MANPQSTKKKDPRKGIEIVCHGGYYFKTDTAKGIKPFSYELKAPSLEFFREYAQKYQGTDDKGNDIYAERSFLNIRGQLKKRLLPIVLQREHLDFARVKFVVIDEIISLDDSALDLPIQLQSRTQLAGFIRDKQMPIDVKEYLEIDEIRTDVMEYQEDADYFLRNKKRKDKRRKEEREFIEMNELEMNLPPRSKSKKAPEPKEIPANADTPGIFSD